MNILIGQFEAGLIHKFPYEPYFRNKPDIQKIEQEIRQSNRILGLEGGHISLTDLGNKFLAAVLE